MHGSIVEHFYENALVGDKAFLVKDGDTYLIAITEDERDAFPGLEDARAIVIWPECRQNDQPGLGYILCRTVTDARALMQLAKDDNGTIN